MNRLPTLLPALLLAVSLSAQAQDSFGAPPPPPNPPTSTVPPPPAPARERREQAPPAPMPAPSGYGAAPAPRAAGADGDAMARLAQSERQDMGVAATAQLHGGAPHAPTPNAIPGGRLITTAELVPLLSDSRSQALVFDVLGGPQLLPNAIPVVPAAQGGHFQDAVQKEFGQYLQQVTQGRRDRPMVFYCQGTQCWMSYNAALRAINLGYTNVFWYRGGIEAWQQAGLPLQGPGGQR